MFPAVGRSKGDREEADLVEGLNDHIRRPIQRLRPEVDTK